MSGNCLDEDIALFKLNGANEVIVKPLTTTKFQEVVLSAYERFEATQGVTVGDVQTGSDDEEEDDGVVGEFVLTPIRGNSFQHLPDF